MFRLPCLVRYIIQLMKYQAGDEYMVLAADYGRLHDPLSLHRFVARLSGWEVLRTWIIRWVFRKLSRSRLLLPPVFFQQENLYVSLPTVTGQKNVPSA